jgi:hypothetical protein
MTEQTQGGVNAIQRRFEELRDNLEIRDKGIKREFQNVHEKIDCLNLEIRNMTARMGSLETFFRNSRIAHLRQPIIPRLVYDRNDMPVPVPSIFPSTALKFYHLQDRKYCTFSPQCS